MKKKAIGLSTAAVAAAVAAGGVVDGHMGTHGRLIGSKGVHVTTAKGADSDGDGLIDGYEILWFHTDPNDRDSDDDWYSDYDELYHHLSDPNDPDTDDDGFGDGDEILNGTNPSSADSHP